MVATAIETDLGVPEAMVRAICEAVGLDWNDTTEILITAPGTVEVRALLRDSNGRIASGYGEPARITKSVPVIKAAS